MEGRLIPAKMTLTNAIENRGGKEISLGRIHILQFLRISDLH